MGAEIITVEVDGRRYQSWTRVQVRASMAEAARSFRLEAAFEIGALATAWTFRAGSELSIYANDDLLLTGFVDRYQPQIEGRKASVVISGRSKSADAIDSSALHPTGRFENKKPDEIANEIMEKTGLDLKVSTDRILEPVESYQLTPGESIFRCLERMCRSQGMSLMGEADGSIRITNAEQAERQRGGIFEGVNLLKGSADHNWSNRHSEYYVRGQRPFGTGADNLEVEALARDAGVDRKRVIVVVQDDDTDEKRAKKRAKNRRDRAAGNGLRASITTQGYRDEAGTIWTPGCLVWVESTALNIAQDMLIESVNYSQDDGGSVADLELCDPRAHGGKKGKGNKSGKDWDQSDEDAVSE